MTTTARPERFVTDLVAWLNVRFEPARTIAADTRLFAGGLIDSIRILEIIAWVERAIGQRIPDVQISMENFQTPTRIAEVFLMEVKHVER